MNREIAENLGITVSTVEAHVGAIYRQHNVHNLQEFLERQAQLQT
jgi:DNA-binding NarL/FixJ family response regulator